MTIMYLHARKEKKGKNKEKEEALVGNKVEVREGCCEWWWLMYVRAIYIPLCKKISSSSSQTLPFCLFPPIHPFSTLLKFLPSFPSVEAASRASRASLPSCLQREHPSTRRFGKLPLFLSRSNISAASKRRARHHAFPVKRLPLDFLSTRRTRDREGSPSEILEVWIFVWMFFFEGKVGKREFSAPSSRMEGRSKRLDENDGKVKVKEKAERFFWGWLRVN